MLGSRFPMLTIGMLGLAVAAFAAMLALVNLCDRV
jgi:hypothetical protein